MAVASGPYSKGPNLGYEQITGSGVKSLTAPAGATQADIQAEKGNWRFRSDGTDPTATVGYILSEGEERSFSAGENLAALRFIVNSDLQASPDAVLNVNYY
jgi:hypothetical protein